MPERPYRARSLPDILRRATLFDGNVRAVIAMTTTLTQTARDIHNCAPTAAAALGRTLTGTLLLASSLKAADDSLTVSIKGGGPIGAIVCVGGPDGAVKGYAENPSADPPRVRQGKLDVGAAVGKDGSVTVIKDLGLKEPFIGRTSLVSGEIGEDLANYLLVSEQTPSLVALGVLCAGGTTPCGREMISGADGAIQNTRGMTSNAGVTILGAGGVMLQPMPGCPEDVIKRLEVHAPLLSNLSRLCAESPSFDAFADAVLCGLPHEYLGDYPVRFACRCDRARIERVLLSLGEAELRDMIREDGKAQVGCQFCGRKYDFTGAQLEALVAEGLC